MSAQTLGQLLVQRAVDQRAEFRFLHTAERAGLKTVTEDGALVLTASDLERCARRAAHRLQQAGVQSGDRVLLLLPTGVHFLSAFFACQLLGAVPVPLVPPWSLDRVDGHLERMKAVAQICTPVATVVTPEAAAALYALDKAGTQGVLLRNPVSTDELLAGKDAFQGDAPAATDAPAFLQFTSGSTSAPKGVVITHRSVLADSAGIGSVLGLGQGEHSACSWLPLFHDMGLIGHVIVPLLWGVTQYLMPPEVFVRQPRTWLEAMSRYRCTISTAPNFAYDLCAAKIKDRDVASLDLSAWQVAMCGGEPVLPATLRRFSERFAPVGFRSSAFMPVYGLAECCLAATMRPAHRGSREDQLDRAEFEQSGRAAPGTSLEVVSVGFPIPGHEVRIVDEERRPLPDRQEGDVQVKGEAVLSAYFENPSATAAALQEGWLHTGDRGYLADGELFITGRERELVIKGGRNLYPYDIEAAAATVKGVRAGRCAAFGVMNEDTGTEDLVLLCETKETAPEARAVLERAVQAAVATAIGLKPDVILLLEPGALSKTSSGKMQRGAAKERYLASDLSAPRVSALRIAKVWAARTRARLAARRAPPKNRAP